MFQVRLRNSGNWGYNLHVTIITTKWKYSKFYLILELANAEKDINRRMLEMIKGFMSWEQHSRLSHHLAEHWIWVRPAELAIQPPAAVPKEAAEAQVLGHCQPTGRAGCSWGLPGSAGPRNSQWSHSGSKTAHRKASLCSPNTQSLK